MLGGASGCKFTRRDSLACSRIRFVLTCMCESVSAGVVGRPGALWRVEPRPLCRRARGREREREGNKPWGLCRDAWPHSDTRKREAARTPPCGRKQHRRYPGTIVYQRSQSLPRGQLVINGFWSGLATPGQLTTNATPWIS